MPLIRLGQTDDASVEVTIFTCDPAIYSFVTARSLIVTNRSATGRTFSVRHLNGGVAVGNSDYWFRNTPIVPNQGLLFPLDCGLSPTDTIRVEASSADLTFNLYGEK
jgi:hypothetical protein